MSFDPAATVATAMLDGIGDAFYAIDSGWVITFFNAGAERHFGLRRDQVLGRLLWDVVPGSYDTALGRRFREIMASGEATQMENLSIVVEGRYMEARLFPLPGGLGVSFRDATERHRAEQALLRREAELARVQRIAHVGGLEVDLRGGFSNRRSPEYLQLHGLPPEAADEPHSAWVARIHPDDRERIERHFKDTVLSGAHYYGAEYRIIRPSDGSERWIEASAEIERDETGLALRLVGAHQDVTERKHAEERRQLLVNELNHRVKNTLATIQSIGRQVLRGPGAANENVATFENRLIALSRAHDVLTGEDWRGADIRTVVAQAVLPFAGDDGRRIACRGETGRLLPEPALALAMALHELATNAAKYGALSVPGGLVSIVWTLAPDGEAATLLWRETGGPAVVAPARLGFGSRLIEKALAASMARPASIRFDPAGLTCELTVPLAPG